jgi:hypothetical protein
MAKKFIRWKVSEAQKYVSVCLGCCQFVCAVPVEVQVDEAEAAHRCRRAETRRKGSSAESVPGRLKSHVSRSGSIQY